LPINVAFIRGTTADPDGNITMEREALILENLAMALAAKNSQRLRDLPGRAHRGRGTLDSRHVGFPEYWLTRGGGEPQHHMQTWASLQPGLSGEVRIPTTMLPPLPLDDKK